jgi:hypothetical protein
MTKQGFMRIILSVGSILIIIGVLLMAWTLATRDDRNVIRVQLADGQTRPIRFENLALVPGEQCSYTVLLSGTQASGCTLYLDFVETEEKTLKNFARVKIVSGEEALYDELLATAFSDEEMAIAVDFNNQQHTELEFIYYLPLDVGNEAKNAEAVFELLLTASNE